MEQDIPSKNWLTNKVVAGTGHRPDKLGGYTWTAAQYRIGLATRALKKLQPSKVISGMALGWDQDLASAALNLGIPLVAAIPFEGQESRWPEKSRWIYNDILNKSEKVVVCDGGYAPWKMQKRNIWMVDNCELLLALYNGTSGGTENCIKYAESSCKDILNLWPLWDFDK